MNQPQELQPELGFDAGLGDVKVTVAQAGDGDSVSSAVPVLAAKATIQPGLHASPCDATDGSIPQASATKAGTPLPDKPGRRAGPVLRPKANNAGEQLPDKLYFKIGEVAKLIGVAPYVLRYWETEFSQIKPVKSQAKQRLYKRQDVETITTIHELLYNQRFTISGARRQLTSRGKIARVNTAVTATEHDDVAIQNTTAPLPVTPTPPPVAAIPGEKMPELRSVIGEMDEFLAE